MGRRAIITAALAASLLGSGFAVPAAARDGRPPLLLGVPPAGGPGWLRELHPNTLRPVGPRRVQMRGYVEGLAARSPNGQRLALGVSARGRIQLVAARPLGARGVIELGVRGSAGTLAWVAPRRLHALVQGARGRWLVTVDPQSRRVLSRSEISGEVRAAAAAGPWLVAALARPGRIGPSSLLVAGPTGEPRVLPLGEVRSGFVPPPRDADSGPPVAYEATPGLAVDPASGHAYVAAPGRALLLVDVDLATGTRTVHLVGAPSVSTAKVSEGSQRSATWLGAGVLAVAGSETTARDGRVRPYGVRLLDTANWTQRALSDEDWFVAGAVSPLVIVPERDGLVSAYDRAGTRLWRFRAGGTIGDVRTIDGRVLVTHWRRHRTSVLDGATGRRLRVLPTARLPLIVG